MKCRKSKFTFLFLFSHSRQSQSIRNGKIQQILKQHLQQLVVPVVIQEHDNGMDNENKIIHSWYRASAGISLSNLELAVLRDRTQNWSNIRVWEQDGLCIHKAHPWGRKLKDKCPKMHWHRKRKQSVCSAPHKSQCPNLQHSIPKFQL